MRKNFGLNYWMNLAFMLSTDGKLYIRIDNLNDVIEDKGDKR
jgi:hypothetical protein